MNYYEFFRSTPRVRPGAWDQREYLDVVCGVLTEWNTQRGEQMTVRFLLSIDRTTNLTEAMAVVDLAVAYRASTAGLVVGLDFCGAIHPPPLSVDF